MTLLSAIEHAAHGLGCGLGRIAEALERIALSLEHQELRDLEKTMVLLSGPEGRRDRLHELRRRIPLPLEWQQSRRPESGP